MSGNIKVVTLFANMLTSIKVWGVSHFQSLALMTNLIRSQVTESYAAYQVLCVITAKLDRTWMTHEHVGDDLYHCACCTDHNCNTTSPFSPPPLIQRQSWLTVKQINKKNLATFTSHLFQATRTPTVFMHRGLPAARSQHDYIIFHYRAH